MKKILSLAAMMLLTASSAVADDLAVTWGMGSGAQSTGVAEPASNAYDIAWAVGDGMKVTGTKVTGDVTFTTFAPTSSDKGTNSYASVTSMAKYVEFSFTPVGGMFTPTKVSFDVIKYGTGDPNIFVDVIDGENKTINVAGNASIQRDAYTERTELEVSGASSSEGTVTLRIYFGKLASNKSVGLANVTVSGTLTSADAPVFGVAPRALSFKTTPLQRSVSATVTLSGKNLPDGSYPVAMPEVEGLSISPATFVVSDGAVSQEFTVTYTSTADVSASDADIVFAVEDQVATVTVDYQSRANAYAQTVVSGAKEWDWETLPNKEVKLTEETVPSINDTFVFQELEDLIDFGTFDAQSIVISNTQFPLRNSCFQNGTIKFRTSVPGVITVDFSDTGSSGDAFERYINVNGVNTEFFTMRDGSSDRKVTGNIRVPAGEVSVTGMKGDYSESAPIRIYKVTFAPEDYLNDELIVVGNQLTDGTYYYATACPSMDIDFNEVEGIDAFIGKKDISWEGTYVTMSKLNKVPAGTPVVVRAEAPGFYVIPLAYDWLDPVSEEDNDLRILASRTDVSTMVKKANSYTYTAAPATLQLRKDFTHTSYENDYPETVTEDVLGFFAHLTSKADTEYLEQGTVYVMYDEDNLFDIGTSGYFATMNFSDDEPAIEVANMGELNALESGTTASLSLQYTGQVTYVGTDGVVIEDYTGGALVKNLPVSLELGQIVSGTITGVFNNDLVPTLDAAGTNRDDIMDLDVIDVAPANSTIAAAFRKPMTLVKLSGLTVYKNDADGLTIEDIDGTNVPLTNWMFDAAADAKIANLNDGDRIDDVTGYAYIIPQTSPYVSLYGAKQYNFQPVSFGLITTGITEVEQTAGAKEMYNLNGMRVAAPQKGVYVVNGKKVVVR